MLAAMLLTAQAPAPSPTPSPTPAPAWLPRDTADLTVLDKVSARTTSVSVKVGGSAQVGSLTIAVRACEVRPSDVAADATVFLDVTDATAGAPTFHGWMILSAPAVSALEHPVYDVRLSACR